MSQAPRLHVAPRASSTFGDLAGDFAADYGLRPDPWQQLVLDDWLATSKGKWSSLTCGLSVPRQNGKNALIEVRELFGMVGRGEKILHTAHEVKTARKAFKRLQFFFGSRPNDPAAKYPELNARVAEVRNVNGQEAIFLTNGGSVEIVARSKNSARGFTVDVLVMDEAQEMSDDDIEALMPTTSSAPLRNPQWIFTGTPPGPSANGEVFTRTRTDALGKGKRTCWHEWSCESADDLDRHEAWRAANPALLTGRLQFDVVEGERGRFSDDGFRRERLGMWAEAGAGADKVTNPEAWKALCVPAALPEWPLAAIGLDMDLSGRLWTSVAAHAGEAGTHLELLPDNLLAAGQDAAVAWLWERCKRRLPVVMPAESGARVLQAPLLAKGMKVYALNGPEVAQMSASLAQGVTDKTVSHLEDELLQAAVESSERDEGKTGQWRIRRAGEANGAPLLTVAAAHFGAVKWSKRRTGERRGRTPRTREAVVL